jgi:multimeric flavodoxin WrbA
MARKVLGLVASPNAEGRTCQVVNAILMAAEKAGADADLVRMAEHVVQPCKDCNSDSCMEKQRCSFEDPGLEYLTRRLLNCDALVFGTPVYWKDTSAMAKYLILKMFRLFAAKSPLAGLPALGIGVAGNTGNGLISGLRPIYHFFQMLHMRALPPYPATRFNWGSVLSEAEKQGTELAGLATERRPFQSMEDLLLWYDNLPYLSLNRADEVRLLAALATAAVPDEAAAGVARRLADAEHMKAQGNSLESLKATASVFWRAVKDFDERVSQPEQACPAVKGYQAE